LTSSGQFEVTGLEKPKFFAKILFPTDVNKSFITNRFILYQTLIFAANKTGGYRAFKKFRDQRV